MAVKIEILQDKNNPVTLDVSKIASFQKLSYGFPNDFGVLDINQTGDYTILFDSEQIARGLELTFDDDKNIYLKMQLPTSTEEIHLLYNLIKDILNTLNVDHFFKDDQMYSIYDIERLLGDDLKTNQAALSDITQEIINQSKIFHLVAALYPISIGISEVNTMQDDVDKFADLLHLLQIEKAYYQSPRFYETNGDKSIFGSYYIPENERMIIPIQPKSPFLKLDHIDAYYILLPGDNFIPYDVFFSVLENYDYFDAYHVIVKLDEDTIHEIAVQHAVNVDTKAKKKGFYFGRAFDYAKRHSNKVYQKELKTDPLNGYNHLAAFLYWMAKNDFLSSRLINEVNDIKMRILNEDVRLILKEEVFNHQLCYGHFKKEIQDFIKSFYLFNYDEGYPSKVDLYALEYFGEEKYNSKEFDDEAYLFVEYDDAFIEKMCHYIDEEYAYYLAEKESYDKNLLN